MAHDIYRKSIQNNQFYARKTDMGFLVYTKWTRLAQELFSPLLPRVTYMIHDLYLVLRPGYFNILLIFNAIKSVKK